MLFAFCGNTNISSSDRIALWYDIADIMIVLWDNGNLYGCYENILDTKNI